MINIIYEADIDLFSFIATPNNKENEGESTIENINRLDELLEAVSGEVGLFAAAMPGSTEEAYIEMVDIIENVSKDEKINETLDLMIEKNEDNIFLNNETKEEAVYSIVCEFKKVLEEIETSDDNDVNLVKELSKASGINFVESTIEIFKESMKELYEIDISNMLEDDVIDNNDKDNDFDVDLF